MRQRDVKPGMWAFARVNGRRQLVVVRWPWYGQWVVEAWDGTWNPGLYLDTRPTDDM